MKVLAIRGFMHDGQAVVPGSVVDVSAATALELIATKKAQAVDESPPVVEADAGDVFAVTDPSPPRRRGRPPKERNANERQ